MTSTFKILNFIFIIAGILAIIVEIILRKDEFMSELNTNPIADLNHYNLSMSKSLIDKI